MKPMLLAPGTKRLKLKYEKLLTTFGSVLLSSSTCGSTPWRRPASCQGGAGGATCGWTARGQGLTLVNSSDQRKNFLWDLVGGSVGVTNRAQNGAQTLTA